MKIAPIQAINIYICDFRIAAIDVDQSFRAQLFFCPAVRAAFLPYYHRNMAATSCISSIRAPAPVRLATRRSGKSSMSLIVHDGIARGEFEWDAGTRPWKV